MKRKLLIILLLLVAIFTMAETSLIIQPLTGNEQSKALSSIGYIKVTYDSLYIYSHSDMLLGMNAIMEIRHIRYVETSINTSIEDTKGTDCRIYPNPTQDMLVVDNAGCEKAFIFDLSGRLLQTVSIHGSQAIINVTSLPQGDYILLLNTQTYKFIKH